MTNSFIQSAVFEGQSWRLQNRTLFLCGIWLQAILHVSRSMINSRIEPFFAKILSTIFGKFLIEIWKELLKLYNFSVLIIIEGVQSIF